MRKYVLDLFVLFLNVRTWWRYRKQLTRKVVSGVFAFILSFPVLYFMGYVNMFFDAHASPVAATVATAYTEELLKLIFIACSGVAGIVYVTVQGVAELVLYLKMAMFLGVFVPYDLVIVRLMCIGLHFTTLAVLSYGVHKARTTKKARCVTAGFFWAVLIHLCWNLYAGYIIKWLPLFAAP